VGSQKFTAMAIYPFIISKLRKAELGEEVILHEKIHFRQQLEMLYLPFFVCYYMEFLYRWMQHKNRYEAYKNISFEREAYAHQSDMAYLTSRKPYRWIRFI
jgi:hypothetical protein